MNFQVYVANEKQLTAICAFYEAQGYKIIPHTDIVFIAWVIIRDDRTLQFNYTTVKDAKIISFVDAFKVDTRVISDIATGSYLTVFGFSGVYMCVRFNKQTYGVDVNGVMMLINDTEYVRPATFKEYIACKS